MISNREMYNKYDLLGKRSQKWDNKYIELSRTNDFIAMVKHLKTAFLEFLLIILRELKIKKHEGGFHSRVFV